jgi:transposase
MSGKKTPAPMMELALEELEAILERAKAGAISQEEYTKLKALIYTFALLQEELQAKKTSLDRLRQMLFGPRSERTREVLGEGAGEPEAEATEQAEKEGSLERKGRSEGGVKRQGHGRNGAAAYAGAQKVKIPHPLLQRGDACPGCSKGKIYPLKEPAVRVRFRGMAPLQATVYECDRLRCNLCGEVYTASTPAGVGEEKYDETAAAAVGLMRYGIGVPHNQIEKLQGNFGIPLPSSTQWELVEGAAHTYRPVHEAMQNVAADGTQLYNDDTTMKVLGLTSEQRAAALGEDAAEERTGVFTSGIVSIGQDHRIALFFTGVRHAGENLAEILKRRSQELPAPIQMCDGLDHNLPKEFETLLCRCVAHARRKYVEVAGSFPEEVRFVLNTLKEVYKIEARARTAGLDAKQRLKLHQDESGPLMQALREWMTAQFTERRIEPNSGLGKAIKYMDHNWEGMTRFLQAENAPLDNNITERALKKAIRHRRNSLFYRTLNGARVGDIHMALIHTAELNGVNAFDYLVALLRHPKEITERPGEWMPWTYRATLTRLDGGPDPPA